MDQKNGDGLKVNTDTFVATYGDYFYIYFKDKEKDHFLTTAQISEEKIIPVLKALKSDYTDYKFSVTKRFDRVYDKNESAKNVLNRCKRELAEYKNKQILKDEYSK